MQKNKKNLETQKNVVPLHSRLAEIAQLVEHDLAKVGVASASLVFRSPKAPKRKQRCFFVYEREIPASLNARQGFDCYDGDISYWAG